jgi:transcription-repair coupling factor
MHELLERFSRHEVLPELARRLAAQEHLGISGVAGCARTMLAAALARNLGRAVVLIPDDARAARALYLDLTTLAPDLALLLFDPDSRNVRSNLAETLSRPPAVIVASSESLSRPAPATAETTPEMPQDLTLKTDQQLTPARLVAWLEENAYERTDLVTEPGEYATRGGIVDVFGDDADAPARIEFAGDAVASLRTFDPLLQRSVLRSNHLRISSRRAAPSSDLPASTLLPADVVAVTEGREIESSATLLLSSEPDAEFNLGCGPAARYLGNFELLRRDLRADDTAARRFEWFIAASTGPMRERLVTVLGPGPRYLLANLSSGFVCGPGAYGLLTEREIYGSPMFHPARRRFKGLPVDNIVALRPGDRVVHIDYGIGSFEGTRRMTHGDVDKDYVVIAYAGNDKVYVPVENIGLLDRYVGAEDSSPALDRLGGRSWLSAKAEAARHSAEYAAELLQTYARRETARGTSLGPDGTEQAELEALFPYEETPDQLKVMREVKQDMERSRPMDRLVCGDVGYGKTEVALRAAFKAANGLKQVALIAPTTILCYQHYTNFRKRLARFPLRVEMLSRLVSPAKQREVAEGIKAGVVDIVIGTHLLLNSRIAFRDLGLLIIDEEQKFGVRQKERIKSARAAVHVLTLTATPIPRTLYMSLSGLRDISQIHTPPPGRREIATEVAAWNDGLIQEYVNRELARGGQVFFVHNEIESIQDIADRLARILPGVKMAIAHGQMTGRRLADIYIDFAAGEFQLLLSTAIIESGLDMPNVNTIVVNRADRFGLADLHQLRGRVGRAEQQAHALFLVPGRREITGDATKRLSALLAYSRLGSGFKLALRDMELRGVGNLLGTEQHGQVARVGFNLYTQMLKEAVAKLKGEQVAHEPELSLDVSAYIPKEYVEDSYERVALYKRLLAVETETELEGLRDELADRFGRYPAPVETLFKIALVRVRARQQGVLRVSLKQGTARIVGSEAVESLSGTIDELLGRLDRARS